MTKPGRIPCCVPFCPRAMKGEPEGHWWVCGPHWRAIPLKRRRAYQRAVMERVPDWWPDIKATRFTAPRFDRSRQGKRSRSIYAVFRLAERIKAEARRRAL